MRITKKTNQNRNKLIIAGIAVAVLIAAAVMAYFLFFAPKNTPANELDSNPTVDLSKPATDEEIQTGKDIKEETIEQSSDNGQTPPSNFSAIISAAQQNGSTLQIRTLIEKVSNDGQCTLVISKGSVSKSYEAGIQASSSSSTCKGFDIPVSELGAGTWTIKITIVIDANTTIITKDVTIT